MAEKTVKSRVQVKRGTSAEWALATNFYPLDGEIIFYSDLNKIKVGNGTTLVEDLPFISGDLTIRLTWSELKALKEAGRLIPGQEYRITDYVTLTTAEHPTPNLEFRSAEHPFDLIVVADDINVLNENARACLHDGDTYFTNSKLESWEIKYCLDNDNLRFLWADPTNGKGVIYYMKDEWNNECSYDFKNIQFRRYRITDGPIESFIDKYYAASKVWQGGSCDHIELSLPDTFTVDQTDFIWCYTFNKEETNEDASIGVFDGFEAKVVTVAQSNIIKATSCGGGCIGDAFHLNNIVLYGSCYSNKINENCYNITFGNYCYNNTFGNDCYNNTFGNDCYDNIFGNSCHDNTFGDYYTDHNHTLFSEITYSELTALRDRGELVPGKQYRITDYITTTTQEDTRPAGHQFDIIVTADSNNTLNENARATYHYKEDGGVDPYFITGSNSQIITDATYKPNITLDDVQILYNISDEKEGKYDLSTDATVITKLTTHVNEAGVEVPALLNPAPDEGGHDCLYVYRGKAQFGYKNELVSIYYVISQNDETLYEGNAPRNNSDVFVEIGIVGGLPVMYKTDPTNVDAGGLTEVDYADEFKYLDNFELDGVVYNRWEKYEAGEYSGYDFLTNVIVVNNEFTITQEDFAAAVVPNIYDKWQEYYADKDEYESYYKLTNEIIDATFGDSKPDVSTAKANLSAWEIKYCLDNTTSRYIWADGENGKGVIYYMKDEFNNEAPYDFKNIQFKRPLNSEGALDLANGTDTWCYTFGGKVDRSIYQDGYETYRNNIIGNNYIEGSDYYEIPDNVFVGTTDTMNWNNTLGNNCTRNTFGNGCWNNTFGNYCYDNIFGNECYDNIFGNGCSSNTFGNSCSSNTFGTYCQSNTFGDDCLRNTFGNNCSSNTFGVNCNDNTFDSYCTKNTFKNSCLRNTFGNNCSSNTLKNFCEGNIFGWLCQNNIFNYNCYYNTFKGRCIYNTLGTYCASNTFGNNCSNNTFGNESSTISYCKNITLDDDVSYTYINTTDTSTSGSRYLQNINIHKGITGASSTNRLTITAPSRDLKYSTDYYKSGSKEVLL